MDTLELLNVALSAGTGNQILERKEMFERLNSALSIDGKGQQNASLKPEVLDTSIRSTKWITENFAREVRVRHE